MPNVTISDLPLAILPISGPNSFFEVQTFEGGVPVSRKVAADQIQVMPIASTVDNSTLRGSFSVNGTFSESVLLQVSDDTLNDVTINGAGNAPTAGLNFTLNAPAGFDTVLLFQEGGASQYRQFWDSSAVEMKHRLVVPGIIRFEQGNGSVLLAELDSTVGQARLWAGLAGSDVPVARTVLPASGGLEVDNQVTGAGFERVLTTSDLGGGSLPTGNQGDIAFISTAPGTYSATSALQINPGVTLTTLTMEVGPGGTDGAVRVQGASGGGIWINVTAAGDFDGLGIQHQGFGGVNVSSIRADENGIDATPATLQLFTYDGTSLALAATALGGAAFGTRFNGVEVTRTVAAASGGLEVNNTATGAGFERVLTTSDAAGGSLPNAVALGDTLYASTLPNTYSASSALLINSAITHANTTMEVGAGGLDGIVRITNGGGASTILALNNDAAASFADGLRFSHNGAAALNFNAISGGDNGIDTTAATLVFSMYNGATTSNMLILTGGGTVEMFHAGGVGTTRSAASTSGGLEVNNQLTGAGYERVLTTSDLGGGGAQISGTPANNQIAVWTNATDIEGQSTLTFTGAVLTLDGLATADLVLDAAAGQDASIFLRENAAGRGQVIYDASANELIIEALVAGEDIRLRGAGVTAANFIANGQQTINHAGVGALRTVTAANGSLEVNNLSTGAGFERVLTTADLGGGSLPSGALNDMIYISTAPGTYSATSALQLIPGGTNTVDLVLGNTDAGDDITFRNLKVGGNNQFDILSGTDELFAYSAGSGSITIGDTSLNSTVIIDHGTRTSTFFANDIIFGTNSISADGNSSSTDLRALGPTNGSGIFRWGDTLGSAGQILIGFGATNGAYQETGMILTRDGNVSLNFNNVAVARTLTAANGGFEVDNSLTGGGFERVLTESDGGWTARSILAVQEDRVSTTTLTAIAGFNAALTGGLRYKFRVILWVGSNTAGTNPGLRLQADYNATLSANNGRVLEYRNSGLVRSSRVLTNNTLTGIEAGSSADENMVIYEGTIETLTSGTLTIQCAQNVSNATGTAVEENSSFEIWTA